MKRITFVFLSFFLSNITYGQVITLSCISKSDGGTISIELKTNREDGGNGTIIINSNRSSIGTFTKTNITWSEKINETFYQSNLNRLNGILTVISQNLSREDLLFRYECNPQSKKF
jgi:hypothetical protein